MGKPKGKAKQELASKGSLNTPKQGFIQKNKTQKFKQTPTGKVNLINGSKAQRNNDAKKQKALQKGNNASPQKSPQNNAGKKNSPRGNKKQQQVLKKQSNTKTVQASESDEDESDEDINEGITPMEESSFAEDDDVEDEESSEEDDDEDDNGLPDLLGASLADDTDDEDFEEDEESEDDVVEKNGVKMFKGLKSKNKSSDSSKDETLDSSKDTSLLSDKSETPDDDEDVDEDVDEDDDEEDDEDDEDDDDDDDDDEEDDEEESEEEEAALGLKALLGNSIADDEDDEDFDEAGEDDEDDDISDEDEEEEGNNSTINSSKQNVSLKDETPSPEKINTDEKTIFVGNLPRDVEKSKLKKLFRKFGEIVSIRFRGAVPENAKTSKKLAVIAKKFHPKVETIIAYIAFKTEESAKAALVLNGQEFEGKHLRVDLSCPLEDSKRDGKKSVFLGNLAFRVKDDDVRKHFKDCGEIESIRIIKDKKTGVGKGFGYINFVNEDGVALALEMNGTTILNREVRVKKCTNENQDGNKTKNKHRNKRSLSSDNGQTTSPKKSRTIAEATVSAQNKENAVRRKVEKEKQQDKQNSPEGKSTFQGQKADAKKKKKQSKFEKKKKVMAAKLTAKPKKPTN